MKKETRIKYIEAMSSEEFEVKWVICGKGRRVSEDCRACDSYYLERRRNVPEIRGGNEEKTDGHGVSCGVTRLNMVESIPQEKRTDTVHAS